MYVVAEVQLVPSAVVPIVVPVQPEGQGPKSDTNMSKLLLINSSQDNVGVILGVILGVAPTEVDGVGVILNVGVIDGVGVIVILGVTDVVDVVVIDGVIDSVGVNELVGVIDEVGVIDDVGVLEIVGVTVGVTVGVIVEVGVGDGHTISLSTIQSSQAVTPEP